MSTKDGGNAFPAMQPVAVSAPHLGEGIHVTQMHAIGGMTLRDWFAGQIIGHVAADPTVGRNVTAEKAAAHLARLSYAIADAMIAEREL